MVGAGALPNEKTDFSPVDSGFVKENDGFTGSLAPNDNVGGVELTGVWPNVGIGVAFFPKISMTLPVSSVVTLDESGTEPKLKIGFDLEAAVVVVAAALNNPEVAWVEGILKNPCDSSVFLTISSGTNNAAGVLISSIFLTGSDAGRKSNNPPVGSIGVAVTDVLEVTASDLVGSLLLLMLPNLNPPAVSSVLGAASIEAPNLNPTFSVFWLGSIEAPNLNPADSCSIFLAGSIDEPNLNPGASLGVSIVAPNLKPEEASCFLLASVAPNENSFENVDFSAPVSVEDDSSDGLRFVVTEAA